VNAVFLNRDKPILYSCKPALYYKEKTLINTLQTRRRLCIFHSCIINLLSFYSHLAGIQPTLYKKSISLQICLNVLSVMFLLRCLGSQYIFMTGYTVTGHIILNKQEPAFFRVSTEILRRYTF